MLQVQFENVSKSKLILSCKRRIVVMIFVGLTISAGYVISAAIFDPDRMFSNTAYFVLGYHLFNQVCFYILWFSNSLAVTEAAQQYNSLLAQVKLYTLTAQCRWSRTMTALSLLLHIAVQQQ